MSKHKMHLHPKYFEKMGKGEKTVEFRLYDEKRKKILAGDRITFINADTQESISAIVSALAIGKINDILRMFNPCACQAGFIDEVAIKAFLYETYIEAFEPENGGLCAKDRKRPYVDVWNAFNSNHDRQPLFVAFVLEV